MLVELRGRSQITIPAEITKSIGATEGDKFDVIAKDGGIFLCPVVVYPKDKIKEIAKIIKETEGVKQDLKAYDDIAEMFGDMGIKIDEI